MRARTCCFCLVGGGVSPYTVALRALGIRHADYAHTRCLCTARRSYEDADRQVSREARERFGAITLDNAADAERWKRQRRAALFATWLGARSDAVKA